MDLIELKGKISSVYVGDPDSLISILDLVEQDNSIFPFNEYEHLICNLLDIGGLTFDQYLEIRTEYINQNPNLWVFEISAPRGFGEKFAQTYVHGKCSALLKPSKKLHPTYSGEYDFWLDGIRIEVKASRAVDSDSQEPLYMKALSRNTNKPFLMNFQQLKPQCCDVFIWVAVFRDEIVLWVFNSNEVRSHTRYAVGQHRGNKGNEGQMHIKHDNIEEIAEYQLGHDDLERAIREAAKRNPVSD
ncbi:MAG: hypothetical protein JKY43_04765 [Phycisphaerales bacterium]|nr:hypothetical protein [Phycisphaerales bacterium]